MEKSQKYYELFAESKSVDWKDLASSDPDSREELETLAKLDGIREAFKQQPVSSSEPPNSRALSGHPDQPPGLPDQPPGPRNLLEDDDATVVAPVPRSDDVTAVVSPGPARNAGISPPVAPPDAGSAPDAQTVSFGQERRSSSQASPRPKQKQFPSVGSYTITEQIGEGSFARIYKAKDFQTGRDVALKLLKSRAKLAEKVVARFLREARAMATLRHDNIVRIYHVIDKANVLGLSMELIDGASLEQVVKDEGPQSPEIVAQTGISLCSALAQVHDSGFVHRDIKTENIMRERGGRVVLMDFGLTHSLDPESRLTDTGILIGTPVAMAPEQYKLQKIDARTDIYAVGCLLYRFATGEYPAMGASVEEIRAKVISGNIEPILKRRADFPVGLAAIIRRSMDVVPDKRFASASEMEAALRAIDHTTPQAGASRPETSPPHAQSVHSVPPAARPAPVSGRTDGPPKTVLYLLVAILLTLVCIIVLLLWLLLR